MSASSGSLAIGAAGALLLLIALVDLFVTVFNYDGFNFLSTRLHRAGWKLVRTGARAFPATARAGLLSIGSAAMVPATYALWLVLEVVAFALMFDPGLVGGSFSLDHAHAGIGSSFYLSAGSLSSLAFGDIVPRSGLFRALTDFETIVGLTTFTLGLGYVVTTFGVLRTLDSLHATVRRHAEEPGNPSSILTRHFRGGEPSELPALLQSISDKLEDYDQGLRRYPVVYYFHTRRLDRSIPRVFARLGDLIALLRWGLPADETFTHDALLAALLDEYVTTLERLQRSFVGPPELDVPEPVSEAAFDEAYRRGDAAARVGEFRELQRRAREAAGISGDELRGAYAQYREWLPFAERKATVLVRVAAALGYEHP